MNDIESFKKIIEILRSENGCPWDKRQTHSSLKAACIEEAAEVICGINILEKTGDADNLKEELGDLLMQVVMHACIAEEEGFFNLDDVIEGISRKMIRRHPHVFGNKGFDESKDLIKQWDDIKRAEKSLRKQYDKHFLLDAFDESKKLIETAKIRKGFS